MKKINVKNRVKKQQNKGRSLGYVYYCVFYEFVNCA